MKILYYPNINVEHFIFKKNKPINKHLELIPLKYKENNLKTDIIIQTPHLYIPFEINRYENKMYLSLSFRNHQYDPEVKSFLSKIKEINKYIKEYIIYKFGKKISFNSNLKYENNQKLA